LTYCSVLLLAGCASYSDCAPFSKEPFSENGTFGIFFVRRTERPRSTRGPQNFAYLDNLGQPDAARSLASELGLETGKGSARPVSSAAEEIDIPVCDDAIVQLLLSRIE
jgi:hypothetical protein